MAAAKELVGDSLQQVESLGIVELKFDALLKVPMELQANIIQLELSQIVNNTSITTGIDYKNDEEKQKAVSNLSSSSTLIHQPALASTTSTLLTPEEDTIIPNAATDNLSANIGRPSTENGNQEIIKVIPDCHNDPTENFVEDGGQVMNDDHSLDGYEELFNAAVTGDWEVASKFLKKNPKAITEVIASDSRTVLHVAIIQGNLRFTEEIVKRMPLDILEYKTSIEGYTALHYAALCGYTKAAEVLVKKNRKLTQIEDRSRRIPLLLALISVTGRQRGTVEYLYAVTRNQHLSPFSGNQGDSLLRHTIDAGYYDIASSLVQRFPELVIDQTKKVQTSAMNNMAERPFAFASGAKHTFWQRRIYPLVKVDVNTAYELDGRTNQGNSALSSEESLPHSLEGTDGDKENPIKRFGGSCRDGKNQPENSENTEEDESELIRAILYFAIFFNLMIKLFKFLGFLMSFIARPSVTCFKQVHKQFYDDKVKHKQAEALVKTIFTTLKERMKKEEVIDFFGGSNVMKMAIRHGSVEIIEVCIKLFPYLIWTQMGGQNMLQMAIAERSETILDLICEESGENKIDLVSRCDDKDNTILHYAAKLAPSAQLNSVSGAYLQMQREKQWFKGVENMIPEKDRFKRNKNGDTAHDIFTKEHKELKESGEKWLKDTSGSCMVVAALIATVAFASAFTVPGGNVSGDSNISKNGIPVFLKKNSFIVFALADALALFSSVTSVLMFLAIYTSRYAEADFLKSLPNKLILGLATLFISIASVLVAFAASLFIVLGTRFRWVLIPIVVFSCVPVTLFAWLQLPLFFGMIRSTYWGNLFLEHTYISSLQLNSKKEHHYKKLHTFVDGFGNYLEKLVSKKYYRLEIDRKESCKMDP
ncbi:hypothetical protein MKW98_020617 [Papaver atlanticum]|uniref:PGG domain-containing protein n=1 Tax=Papaver atlanticum TaxID=357466 RepID=A0AAD4TIB1_9MAGN|nr:hypothetical protein MKW98_020617 [Papaver atlanticum]